jgi:hypothetical protein
MCVRCSNRPNHHVAGQPKVIMALLGLRPGYTALGIRKSKPSEYAKNLSKNLSKALLKVGN